MFSWTMPDEVTPPTGPEADLITGLDIRFASGELVVSAAGDWATVEGLEAVRQSIIGEALTSPGELAFRDEYGMGLAAAVKSSLSQARLAERRQRLLERLAANERVARIREAVLERAEIDGRVGLRVIIRADGQAGGDLRLAPFVIGGS